MYESDTIMSAQFHEKVLREIQEMKENPRKNNF